MSKRNKADPEKNPRPGQDVEFSVEYADFEKVVAHSSRKQNY